MGTTRDTIIESVVTIANVLVIASLCLQIYSLYLALRRLHSNDGGVSRVTTTTKEPDGSVTVAESETVEPAKVQRKFHPPALSLAFAVMYLAAETVYVSIYIYAVATDPESGFISLLVGNALMWICGLTILIMLKRAKVKVWF